ncbi:Hypothetical protein, putative [Bodo saltans]|uniref:NF-X1-type domain-containing protein n=1 Tax=Bodo saltans TaxID=75058 RepID=A0A0S4INE9_BODSA|nr:Hypothetical protein, putative [Bodo saltans]|eukprot:CUE74577.1 Hypothetical protein, putative [Bodo saltans]
MSQNDERRKIRVADTNTLVDPSTLRDDAGLQRARETGYRGRMCEKDGQCRFPRCTFLHSLVVHQAQSTAPARGGGKQGYGRAGGPAAARPPRETPTTKTVTDANQEILEDLVDLLSEENAAELFKQRIAEKTISAVAAFLRDGSGDPFNVIKVASMMLHIICNATPVDPTTDDEKKQQERESGLVLDGVKWFKGLTDVSLQKPRYAKYLQRIVFALLRRIPGDLATGFVTNANLLRAAIPAEEKDVSVWNYYDEMLKAERERQPAAHRSNDDGEPQRRQRRGPTEYTDTDQRQDNAPIDEILINEKDFSDRREKKEILHSLHGIVVDDPVPVDKERRHLEEQFRTFREDFVAAMRSAVKIVRRVVPPQTIPNLQTAQLSRDFQDAIKKCDEDGDVRLYNVATYVGVKPVKSRLVFEFAIDMNQFKNYKANWDKRMMNGNLVMLSTNWFHPGAPIFAGTIERANNRRNDKGNAPQRREEFDGTFGIEVEDPVEMLRLVSHHKGKLVFRMLESTSFFLPYHRVLTVFKETLEKDHNPPSRLERVLGQRPPPTLLPLARELLEGRTDVAPAYIRRSHHLSIGRAISLQEIAIAQDQRVGLDVLDKGAWDLCSEWSSELEAQLAAKGNTFHTIDTTQRDALQHIFSHSVAVVQGTPGTGKTFIGAKFVQIIMQNIARIDCGPIVCICLTNHAIDAFLEQMLTFEKKESIVRLGTMSKNEVIAELSLRSPAKKVFYPKNPEQEQLISEFQIQKRLIDQLVGKHQNLTPSLQEELFRKLQQLRRVGLDVGHLERVLLQDQCVIDDAVRMKKEGLSAIANMLWQLEDKRQTILESYRLDPNIRSKSQLVECKQKRDSIVGKLLTASLHLKKKFDEYFANQEEDVPPSIELAVSKFRALDAERKQSVQENKAQLEQLERQLHQMTQQSEPNNRRKAKKNKSKGQASPNPDTNDGNKEQLTTDIALQRNIIAEEEVKIDESSKFMRDNKFKEYLALQQDCNKTPSYDAVYDELVASFDSAATLHERRNGIQRDLGKLLDQLKTPSLLRWCKYVPGPAPAPPPPPPPPASVALRPHDAAAVEAEMNARAEMEARAVQRGYSAMHRAVDDDDDDDDDVGNVQFDDRFNHDSLTRECHNLTALLRRYDLSDAPDHIRTDVYQKILWIAECQGNTRLQEIINQLATGRKKFEEAEAKVTADALRRHRIIGATTTGAATYVSALRLLRPKVVIVEEAAEVLECQVLSCLPDSVEHLILVGDHKQLQPKVEQEMILGRKKHLSVSLMERLVRIDAPYVTLTTQRRMHPEISFFTKDYYKYPTHPKDKAVDVVDHPSTTLREVPKGVADDRRIIFVAHDGSTPSQCEQENPGLKSKFNSYEAELAVAIAEWLIRHNPTMSVTILAPYSGQVIKTIEFAKKNHVELLTRLKPKGVKIISIDDYQGEESDIIILTLTRTREMGFLKQENRSCVALSRARCGMYIIGCKPLLENTEKNATNLILRRMMDAVNVRLKDVNDGGDGRPDACCVVSQFPAVCPKHPTETLNFSTFKEQEQLTCKKLCGAQLGGCKHHCTKLCHVDTVGHSVCVEQCGRLGAGCHPPRQCTHVCKKKCGDKCGECQEKVDHTCPNCGVVAQVACGKLAANKHRCMNIVHNVVCRVNPENHTFSAPCWKSNDDTFNECKHPCNQKMKCGHTCQRTCHADDENHETGSLTCQQYRDAPHPKCKKHTINARCCDLAKEIVPAKGKAARNAIPKCDKKCGCEVLACHHPCENTCGDCTEHTCLTGTRYLWRLY